VTFADAVRRYVHRFTMEHTPAWAQQQAPNGSYYAPQFRTDREWYENTKFPPDNPFANGPQDTSCYTSGQTWPLGQWLDVPYGTEPLQFAAVRRGVKQGAHYVATAKSSTMARRIANALNRYTPNDKGY
jgi:hypothetical protein